MKELWNKMVEEMEIKLCNKIWKKRKITEKHQIKNEGK